VLRLSNHQSSDHLPPHFFYSAISDLWLHGPSQLSVGEGGNKWAVGLLLLHRLEVLLLSLSCQGGFEKKKKTAMWLGLRRHQQVSLTSPDLFRSLNQNILLSVLRPPHPTHPTRHHPFPSSLLDIH
jgi:hypothetical protein